jgi:beta-lactamase superfamily II metal-dependent hydrolase
LLTLYILNVGHGDSVVIEYLTSTGPVFGVIDSNRTGQNIPAALQKLRELGAKELSFVALTHPHTDHYNGLLEILEAYKGHISSFYTFPLERHRRLKELAKIYDRLYKRTDNPRIRSSLKEFVRILVHAKKFIGLQNWEEPEGFSYQLAPVGFKGVEIIAILPPKRVKSSYFRMIEVGSYEIVNRLKENELSLAFSLKYKDTWIILGGDGTLTNWRYRKNVYSKRSGNTLEADAVQLPHHGAKEDCQPDVIDYLFSDQGERFACISADGRYPHPHPDVFVSLAERNIQPFCTNLADQCGEKIADLLVFDSNIEAQLLRYLNSVVEDSMSGVIQPCQGDITLRIDTSGSLTITPEYDHPCPYRGGYDFLSRDRE